MHKVKGNINRNSLNQGSKQALINMGVLTPSPLSPHSPTSPPPGYIQPQHNGGVNKTRKRI